MSDRPRRRTLWSEPLLAAPETDSMPKSAAADVVAPTVPDSESTVPVPHGARIATNRGAGRGKFGGDDFSWVDGQTLQCPNLKPLRLSHREVAADGGETLRFRARRAQCRGCPLADRCLGSGATGRSGRTVTVCLPAEAKPAMPELRPAVPERDAIPCGLGREPVFLDDIPAAALRRAITDLCAASQCGSSAGRPSPRSRPNRNACA